jgi:DNA-directed RNA polymerase specialized sigma subunit
MEGSINQEKDKLIRKDCDRILRSYRAMNDVLLSSRSYGKTFGEEEKLDESSMRAQMFAIRSAILELEDSRERLFLYHYYIKGHTLETCAKIIGISRRGVYRLKGRAINSISKKLI